MNATDEQRFVLGIAYQAGPSPLIKRGADGHRDYFSPAELEKAAWSYIGSDMIVGVEHIDGTEGHAIIKESYIYRGPDWEITDVAGDTVIVKSGDWLLGAVLDEVAWQLHKSGRITGWSPQGSGKRRHRVAKSAPVTVTVTVPPDATPGEIAKLVAAEIERTS